MSTPRCRRRNQAGQRGDGQKRDWGRAVEANFLDVGPSLSEDVLGVHEDSEGGNAEDDDELDDGPDVEDCRDGLKAVELIWELMHKDAEKA